MARARNKQSGSWRDGPEDYGRLSRLLHWLFASLVFIGAPLGIIGANISIGPMQVVVLTIHKSIGVALISLLLVRLVWRLVQSWPTPIPGPAWMAPAARVSHWALYVLSLAAVLSGWAYSSARDFPVSFFGLFELPPITAPDRALAEILLLLHELAVWGLLTMIALHILAAGYHHLVLKDRTLRRILGGFVFAVGFAMALAWPGKASATIACSIDQAKSALEFTARMIFGLPVTGQFHKFTGQILLDQDRPELSVAKFVIYTDSIDTQDPDTDEFIRSSGLLGSEKHPTATLTTSAFNPRGQGRITITGELELKKIKRPIEIAFKYKHSPDRSTAEQRVVADGSVEFSRLDFGIGAKDWSNTFIFHDTISVDIHLEMICPN